MKWLWSPTRTILTPPIYAVIYGIVLYVAGWMLKGLPDVEVALNNGFYILGINVQYQFAEFFAAVGVFISLVTGIAVTTVNVFSKQRGAMYTSQVPLKEEEVIKPKADIEDITGNLQLVDVAMANKLNKSGIYDVIMLSNAKSQDLVQILRVAPTLANQIIQEAQHKLAEWRRDRLID